MSVDDLELRGVVPSAAELRAAVVVLCVDRPGGGLVCISVEHDHDHLPVGLVVVGPVVAAAPVVERVEIPVLEHGPARLPNHASVVGVRLRITHDLAIARDGIAGEGSGDPSPQEQAQRKEGVDEAREVANPGESARAAAELRGLLAALQEVRGELARRSLAGHAEELSAEGRLGDRGREAVERELARRNDLDDRAILAPDHERGIRDERAHVHREEVLPEGVADDRLVASEELEIARHRARPGRMP